MAATLAPRARPASSSLGVIRRGSDGGPGLTSLHVGYKVDIKLVYGGYMSESREERFRRLAASRGDRLIREIALLGNLANRKNYDYTEDEVEQLFRPIEHEL